MSLRVILSAALAIAAGASADIARAQPFPPGPADQRRAVGDWMVEIASESDGGYIVRQTRAHREHRLEYYVAFWRGNSGPYGHASVEQAGRGCGSEDMRRDPASDFWRPESNVAGVANLVRASLAQGLTSCGADADDIAAALAGFETAFALTASWVELARVATLAEIEAIATYGENVETPEPTTE